MLALAACSATTSTETGPVAEVTWVYDGDTIEVVIDGTATDVRLLGINTPENDECFSEEASDYLRDRLLNREVGLTIEGDDQFGRALGFVTLDDADINEEMVSQGLAIATTDEWGSYDKAEDSAIDAGLGLWGGQACGTGPIPVLGLDVDPFGETVTIVNDQTTSVDMSRWILRDESSRHRYTFPAGTTIAPGGALMVSSDDAGWHPGGSNVWNNDGDIALLQLPDGRVVEHHRYRP